MIDPKPTGDSIIATVDAFGEAFVECSTEEDAAAVVQYLERRLESRGLTIDRSGATIAVA